jgi:hypothetical protein
MCEQLASKICASMFACQESMTTYLYGTEQACLSANAAQCVAGYLPSIDLDEAQACMDAWPTDCTSVERTTWILEYFEPGGTHPEAPAECFYTGDLPDGSACDMSIKCRSGFCSFPDQEATCGICTQPLALHDPCSANCGPGLWCYQNRCIALRDQGEPCDDQHFCQFDLWCNEGTCVPSGLPGTPCNPQDWWSCAPSQGSFCDQDTSECVPFGPPQPLGGACGLLEDGTMQLCDGGACQQGSSLTEDGECIARIDEGGACEPLDDLWFVADECVWPLTCVDGTCQFAASEPGCP